jgi:beta-lactamase class A
VNSNSNCCLAALWLTAIISTAFNSSAILSNSDVIEQLAAIEKHTGGRLGVAALDTASGRRIEYRSTERFAMCSTFKMLLVAAVLARVDKGEDSLGHPISYSATDLLDYAPITAKHVTEGNMILRELCAAAIVYSDNTAANLLLHTIGGPGKLTGYARSLGDAITRLDRNEPSLNSNLPGDVRDTTTPAAMLNTMVKLLNDKPLSTASRQQLENWLTSNTTGGKRLRAGVPPRWRVGDKTGTGGNGATNDIAIIWPENHSPFFVAVYFSDSKVPQPERDAVLAEVGRIISGEYYH